MTTRSLNGLNSGYARDLLVCSMMVNVLFDNKVVNSMNVHIINSASVREAKQPSS